VKRSLEGTEGVREAEVSFEEKRGYVIADEGVTNEILEKAVGKSGRFSGKVITRGPVETYQKGPLKDNL
jgi:hypothetical protein